MKKQIALLIVMFCMSIGGLHAQGVGTVSRGAIFKSLPSLMTQMRQIDSLDKKYNVEIEYERQILQEQGRNIVNNYAPKDNETMAVIKQRMKPEDTLSLNKLVAKGEALEKKKENYDKHIANMQKEKIEPILKRIESTIKLVAVQENLDAVFYVEDMANIAAYLSEKKDITSKVIAILKK
ncbi:MAG TPA: OmpH family outer membrane protein [Edaphocola sp.]|nr:OmpH family outer membrane protein [Edaphocola sp.]